MLRTGTRTHAGSPGRGGHRVVTTFKIIHLLQPERSRKTRLGIVAENRTMTWNHTENTRSGKLNE